MKALKIIQGRVPEVSTKVVADQSALVRVNLFNDVTGSKISRQSVIRENQLGDKTSSYQDLLKLLHVMRNLNIMTRGDQDHR